MKAKAQDRATVVKLSQDLGNVSTDHLKVYVTNADGKIIESTGFKGNEAYLQSSKDALDGNAKIYVSQDIGMKANAKNPERALLKSGAYEAVKNFDKVSKTDFTQDVLHIQRIPDVLLHPYRYYNCLIKGHVRKYFQIDGQWEKMPLCDLRVHICEVETEFRWPYIPIYYRQIPDWVLHEVAQKVVDLHPVPVAHQPIPKPDPIGPVSRMKMNMPLSTLGTTSKKLQHSVATKDLSKLPTHVVDSLKSGSTDLIRQTLIDNHQILYPYFCFWPIYWPWFYTYDEETVVTTDCNGHFEMWENTFSEDGALNIYIWIEANINGQWVTVYKPALPCNTWWNYNCNTEIDITVTDSRVGPCDCGTEVPVDAVWFRSIGDGAAALHIEQNLSSTISVQPSGIGVSHNPLKNAGCTDFIHGTGINVSPFGGTLALEIFCGANIFNAGVTHYRWQTRMVADANQNPVSGSPSLVLGAVSRPYLVKMSATHYETHSVSLGLEGSGTDLAYRLPHHNVALEPIPPTDLPLSPEWTGLFFDSAYIDTNSLTDGVYELSLELLQKQLNGSFLLVPVPKATYQVSDYNDIGKSQDAPNNYLEINAVNNTKADAFKMNVRVDNAHTVAKIHDVRLNETGALSGPCGFIHYDNVNQHAHLSFEASHPRDFATFSYGVVKGNNTQSTGVAVSGFVLSSLGSFTHVSNTDFAEDVTVSQLIGNCPGQAAFSENLYVTSLATDGSNQLYIYDSGSVNAFALTNK